MAKTINIIADWDIPELEKVTRNAKARHLMQEYTDAGYGKALTERINASDICNYEGGLKRIPSIKEVNDYVIACGKTALDDFQTDGYTDDGIPWTILLSAPVTFNQLYNKLNASAQAVLKPIADAKRKDEFIELLSSQVIYNVMVSALDNLIETCKDAFYEILGIA